MNFTYLKYFIDVVNLSSVKKSAEHNFVSQPAVSQGVKRLEEGIGLKLLDHKRNSISVTSDGRALFKAATNLFDSIKQYQDEVAHIKNCIQGELNICISNSLVSSILAPRLALFSKKYPLINWKIKTGKTSDQVKLLESGQIDLGIALDSGALGKYNKLTLKVGEFSLVGTKNTSNRLLITEQRTETELFKDRFYKKTKQPIQEVEIESWSTIYELAKSNYGKGLLPDFIFEHSNLVNYSEKMKIKKSTYEIILFSKENLKSSIALKFIEEFNDNL